MSRRDYSERELQNAFVVKGMSTLNNTLTMSTRRIASVGDPVSPKDAATMQYVDTDSASRVKVDGTLAMTGQLSAPGAMFSSAAGSSASLLMRTGTSFRWRMGKTATAESGSNAGSDFEFTRWSDAGSPIDTPLLISRATGATTLSAASDVSILKINNTARNTNTPLIDIGGSAAGQAANDAWMAMGVNTETYHRLRMYFDGAIGWGPGNVTRDTWLYRNGVGVLKTDGQLLLGADPTTALAAATKQYVDSKGGLTQVQGDARYLQLTGGTMTAGNLTLFQNPVNSMHATSKLYVDTQRDTRVSKSGDTMIGFLYLPASKAGSSQFRLPTGVAPSAPVDGDIWTTSAGMFVQIGASTVGPLSAAGLTQVQGDARYLQLVGGTMTGALTGTYWIGTGVTLKTPAATAANVGFQTNALLRWTFGKSTDPETGAQAGSNFNIAAWDDAGNWLSNPVSIERKTGTVSLKGLTVNGNIATDWIDSNYGGWVGGQLLQDLAPVDPNHLANKAYVDSKAGLTQAAADARYVNIGGDTMTGPLVMDSTGIVLDGPQSLKRAVNWRSSGSQRWALFADDTGQTDLQLARYDNAGNYLDSPFTISRTDGLATFGQTSIGAIWSGGYTGIQRSPTVSDGSGGGGLLLGGNNQTSYLIQSGAAGTVVLRPGPGNTGASDFVVEPGRVNSNKRITAPQPWARYQKTGQACAATTWVQVSTPTRLDGSADIPGASGNVAVPAGMYLITARVTFSVATTRLIMATCPSDGTYASNAARMVENNATSANWMASGSRMVYASGAIQIWIYSQVAGTFDVYFEVAYVSSG